MPDKKLTDELLNELLDAPNIGSVEKVGVRALAAPVSDIRNQLIS